MKDLSGIRVRLGDFRAQSRDSGEQEFSITQLVKHNWYKPGGHFGDIALIKLDCPPHYSRYVQKICLSDKTTFPFNSTDYCFVTGWGETKGKVYHFLYDCCHYTSNIPNNKSHYKHVLQRVFKGTNIREEI